MTDNVDLRFLQRQVGELKAESDRLKKESNTGYGKPPGGSDLEARVARLESDVEYIKRDIGELKGDVKVIKDDVVSIKHRLAYITGGGFVIVALLAWIANNRFDQIITLLKP